MFYTSDSKKQEGETLPFSVYFQDKKDPTAGKSKSQGTGSLPLFLPLPLTLVTLFLFPPSPSVASPSLCPWGIDFILDAFTGSQTE